MSNPNALVEVDGLTRRFGAHHAVTDVTFSAMPGEVLGLLGPNGAGKTTTLRMLAGLLAPTSGHARVAGIDVDADPIGARRHIGYLPEQAAPYDEMTVVAYLRFMARLRRVARGSVRAAVDHVVEETGLASVRRRLVGSISHGFRQRLGLAAALVHQPAVLILDEPTSALDPRQAAEARELVGRLGADRTVILSTHILSEATRLCSRVVIVSRGEVVGVGPPDELARRAAAGKRQLRLRVRGPADEVAAAVRAVPGVDKVDTEVAGAELRLQVEVSAQVGPEVARRITDRFELLELTEETPSLEQAFLSLTK
ncbi:MAG TPA: ABC transporter ATP-binding protein [Acidimicrobiales bacterium]|nr:ABC transporter ATP-binding protein [Acidimicrobiales bacterium]